MKSPAELIPINFLPARVDVERRAGGTLVLRSPEPLRPYARCLGEYLERWAAEKPHETFLAQRDGDEWRRISWGETRRLVHAIAASLLTLGASRDRPVVVLSDNSIEHGLLALAAMHAGVPIAPISPAYSLMSQDFAKLKSIIALIEPCLIFVDDVKPFGRSIAAIASDLDFELVALRNLDAVDRPVLPFSSLTEREDSPAVAAAFATIQPETIAKLLFTSGSTGEPKGVINTQRMLCSNIQSRAQAWPFLEEEPPVLVDWLPWNHTFGGNNDFGLVLGHGGTLYIDGGKPVPGLIETTVRNLRDVSPTICCNAPRGYDALLPYLEKDAALRRSFFARLKVILYAAAALPPNLWGRLERLSIQETGKRVPMTSAWGSTETAPQVTLVHFEPLRTSVIGLPTPGCELKMAPVHERSECKPDAERKRDSAQPQDRTQPSSDAGKYELRVRGPNVTPGYWKRPDLTAAAFDEEGFYRMGDAGRFADPGDPAKGIEFAGRLAEDFKLTSATWVHVGALRVRAISALAPVAQDIVIAGHDRHDVGFLVFPNPAGCRSLCPDLSDAPPQALIKDPRVRERVLQGMASLRNDGGGSSTYATRTVFLEDPPSIDAGEITDKGYINQRAVLDRRADVVEQLYSEPPGPDVINLF